MTSEPQHRSNAGSLVLRAALVLALAGATVAFCMYGTPESGKSEAGVTLNLPAELGGFHGEEQPVSDSEREILPKDTGFAKKAYTDDNGRALSCQIVLAGGEKRSIHRPEICLPSQGWSIRQGGVIPIKLPDGKTLDVMRLVISRPVTLSDGTKTELNSVFIYWFMGKDSTTPHHYMRILKSSMDLLMTNTNHRWAYVIASAPALAGLVPNGLTLEETESMLTDFIAQLYPTIQASKEIDAQGAVPGGKPKA